jgi:hypothetical protein
MGEKLYRIYCDYCHYNRYTKGDDIQDLLPYKRSPIQRTIPKLDPVTKKQTETKVQKLPKQWKCPNCGRLIKARKISGKPEVKHETDLDLGSQNSPE